MSYRFVISILTPQDEISVGLDFRPPHVFKSLYPNPTFSNLDATCCECGYGEHRDRSVVKVTRTRLVALVVATQIQSKTAEILILSPPPPPAKKPSTLRFRRANDRVFSRPSIMPTVRKTPAKFRCLSRIYRQVGLFWTIHVWYPCVYIDELQL